MMLYVVVSNSLDLYSQDYLNYMTTSKYLSRIVLLATLLVSCQFTSQYKVTNQTKGLTSINLILQYFGSQEFYIKPTSPIVKQLNFTFQVLSFDQFYFKITDNTKKRFQVPQTGIFPIDPLQNFTFPIAASAITFQYTSNPFDFRIIRKSNNAIIFSTYKRNIIYSNYYIQIGTELQSGYLYGLGERLAQGFTVKDGQWTIFNRDRGETIDTGIGIQTYGYYPFYLMREKSGLFHVNYFRTSSALDAIKETISGTHFLTYKTVGGIIDFRFFLGDSSPQTAVQKFNFYNGKAYLPPFWSFGYHQSRWGYNNKQDLDKVIYNFKAFQIPLDTIWSDLDYMIDNQVFTIDQTRFPLDYMSDLLEDYHWIPIIDPGIKNSGYVYEEGLKRNAYILDANTKAPFLGKMRVGRTVYPDFFHPNASKYWKDMLDILYSKVQFSGIWLDSNQFTSFCDGRCQSPSTPSVFDYGVDLPYSPGMDNLEGDMPSLNSTHYNGLIEADVHIYNGYIQSYETFEYLKSKGSKPFILTRSSTLGSSKYAVHWTGDNVADWKFLKTSIADNFNNQLWGSQIVGADICGFAQNTTDQLCARWYQLGSFYPFSRNHNQKNAKSQEPYAGKLTLRAATSNLKLRYALLKYIYTLYVSKKGLGTIWKPLFFVFPNDPNLYTDDIVDTQFMFGPDLLFTPILAQGDPQRQAYFPQVNWYDLHKGDFFAKGINTIANDPQELVPIFIREGAIIFRQYSLTVSQTKQLGDSFVLYIGFKFDAASSNATTRIHRASGTIMSIKDYNDQALVDTCLKSGCFYNFNASLILGTTRTLELNVTYNGQANLNQQLQLQSYYLYYDQEGDRFIFDNVVKVKGPTRLSIPIPSDLNLQSE